MSVKFGIMQGRLTKTNPKILQKFPSNWLKEFDYIKKTKLDYIEFFTETEVNKKNPIWSRDGIKKIQKKISQMNYKKVIVCDNFTTSNSFVKYESEKYLKFLIDQLSYFKNSKIIIPIVSKKLNINNVFNKHILVVSKLLDYSRKKNVKLSFEIDSSLSICKNFCNIFSNNKDFGITFDTGNAHLHNKNFYKEFKILKKFINHIHLKDRDFNGKNVILGSGEVKFKLFLKSLNKPKKYNGTMTFETNRGKDPIKTAKLNYQIIKNFLT